MDISFELYKIFYFAAKEGNFSDAAEKLFISQSAVSQAIKSLENKIGGQLFLRKARSVYLTREGETLFKHVEQAYNFIKTAESKILEMKNLASGEVRVGVSDTICKYYLIKYLEKFNKSFPKIKLQVINRTSPQIVQMLKNGSIDLGIATLPAKDKNVRVEEFLTVEDIFVACQRYSDLKHKKISLSELSKKPLLLLEKNSSTRHLLDAFLEEKNIGTTPEIELESVDLLVEFAKIGLGVAHVLKESAALAIESGELFEVKTVETLPKRKLGVITMEDVPLSNASKEFIQTLREGLLQNTWTTNGRPYI